LIYLIDTLIYKNLLHIHDILIYNNFFSRILESVILPSSFCFLKASASSAVKSPEFNTTTVGFSSGFSSFSSSNASGRASL